MTRLPESLTTYLRIELNIPVQGQEPVHGGDIHHAHRIRTPDGPLFLKWNHGALPNLFECEAGGLKMLSEASHSAFVPKPLAWARPSGSRPGFLLLPYIEHRPFDGDSMAALGRALAQLHGNRSDRHGLSHPNYIGTLRQRNDPTERWNDFFREFRIEPQIAMAIDQGQLQPKDGEAWNQLANRLESLLPEGAPSLLHGDLWSGNTLCRTDGVPVLIDPAVYFGNPEMELAFTRLFGGFSDSFYRAYEELNPLQPDFPDRIPIYQLYPLLVHTNLFGGHYARQVQQILARYA